MYAQFQRDNITKYNYYVFDFIKLGKKLNKNMSVIIHVKYIFCFL